MATQRIVILSDTHLGRPSGAAVSAKALRPLWKDATNLIINGDVAEVHHPQHWAQAATQLLQLLDLCEKDDAALTLLSGNHDPFIGEVRHLHLENDQVFVTHGDALHPAIAPWSPAAGRMRRAHEEALAEIEPESRNHLESRLAASQKASHAEWSELEDEAGHSSLLAMLIRPWAIVQVLHYWHVFPKLVSRFVKDYSPQARFVILGHTHRPGIWNVDGRVIINTGAFGFPGKPRAVCIQDDLLEVWPILLRDGLYEYAAKPIASFQLLGDSDNDSQQDPLALKTRPGSERSKATAT